jgi:hypothetical protein
MNIVRNDKLIRKNSIIAQASIIGGLIILGLGLYVSFQMQEQFWLSMIALVIGFILSQLGIYYSNRFGKRPRPDEILDGALKGLDNRYTLYHYSSPVDHLLLGPSGIWIILPRYQRGTIAYTNGRWKQRGGNLYLKLFAQESLGRPDLELSSDINTLKNFLGKKMDAENLPEIHAALVFTNPKTEIQIPEDENPPAETVQVVKLKDIVRKSKNKSIGVEKLKLVQAIIEGRADEASE